MNGKVKNRNVLKRLIKDTSDNMITWTYINSTIDSKRKKVKHIFIAAEHLHGSKYLVVEVVMYQRFGYNNIEIYMQSSNADYKIHVKGITGGSKTLELCYRILENVRNYNEDEKFLEVYVDLFPIYERFVYL
jgi:hypothetical protein